MGKGRAFRLRWEHGGCPSVQWGQTSLFLRWGDGAHLPTCGYMWSLFHPQGIGHLSFYLMRTKTYSSSRHLKAHGPFQQMNQGTHLTSYEDTTLITPSWDAMASTSFTYEHNITFPSGEDSHSQHPFRWRHSFQPLIMWEHGFLLLKHEMRVSTLPCRWGDDISPSNSKLCRIHPPSG